jgi:hypothetical protein
MVFKVRGEADLKGYLVVSIKILFVQQVRRERHPYDLISRQTLHVDRF